MMTFQEALDWAKARKVMLPEDYVQQIDDMVKRQAFTIMGIASRSQLQLVLDSLSRLLEKGGTFDEWKKEVTGGKIQLALPLHRLDNIYRTNLQVHYNHGHWAQQSRNKFRRPYLMYDAVNDQRTRPRHRALDNVIRHIDDPFWQTHYPPIGFRCRCVTIALTEKQAEARGGVTAEPEDGWPDVDKGFTAGVAQNPEKGTNEAVRLKDGEKASVLLQRALELKIALREVQK